jgi:hypothetical protein
MNTYKVQFKNSSLNTASVSGIQAKTATEALLIGAKALGMDTDPDTQTYSLCLEAIQTHNTTETALLKQAYKELNESAKRPSVELTPAQLKRRLLLIAHEKNQAPQPEQTTQADLFA